MYTCFCSTARVIRTRYRIKELGQLVIKKLAVKGEHKNSTYSYLKKKRPPYTRQIINPTIDRSEEDNVGILAAEMGEMEES